MCGIVIEIAPAYTMAVKATIVQSPAIAHPIAGSAVITCALSSFKSKIAPSAGMSDGRCTSRIYPDGRRAQVVVTSSREAPNDATVSRPNQMRFVK